MMLNKIRCIFKGHDWDKRHGYYDYADFGAKCRRCGKKLETYTEWKKE